MKVTLSEQEIDKAITGYLNPFLSQGGMSVVSISVNRLQGSYNAEISCEQKGAAIIPKLVQTADSEKPVEEDPSSDDSEDEVRAVFS